MENTLTMQEKIYIKYKELKEEATTDVKFEKGEIENSFTVTTSLMKWITKRTEWNRLYREFEDKRKKEYRNRFEFYQTDYPLKLSSKEEYSLFIESDPLYCDLMNNALLVKEILQYIDSIIETLKNKQWEVKNYLTYLLFVNGK